MKFTSRLLASGMLAAMGVIAAANLAGCVVREPAHEVYVDDHGYRHEGFYDDHHDWHGGYYDEGHAFHDDRNDWHR
jgi:hypothetical protein